MREKRLSFTVSMTVHPRPRQSVNDAVEEFTELFRDYMTHPDSSFMDDYGLTYGEIGWGGYEGPYVTDVQLDADTTKEEQ